VPRGPEAAPLSLSEAGRAELPRLSRRRERRGAAWAKPRRGGPGSCWPAPSRARPSWAWPRRSASAAGRRRPGAGASPDPASVGKVRGIVGLHHPAPPGRALALRVGGKPRSRAARGGTAPSFPARPAGPGRADPRPAGRRPRPHPHLTPTSASRLDLVGCCWPALLSRRRLERGAFASTDDPGGSGPRLRRRDRRRPEAARVGRGRGRHPRQRRPLSPTSFQPGPVDPVRRVRAFPGAALAGVWSGYRSAVRG
jgi:hypothetical protein